MIGGGEVEGFASAGRQRVKGQQRDRLQREKQQSGDNRKSRRQAEKDEQDKKRRRAKKVLRSPPHSNVHRAGQKAALRLLHA